MIARKDRGIVAPADLKGKSVGMTFGTNSAFLLDLVLASVKGDVKSKRVHVEIETSRLILDVDVHRVDTKVRIRHGQRRSLS